METTTETLARRFRKVAETYPHKTAQLSRNGSEEFSSTTYADLYRTVSRLAASLHEMGVRRGDHVGLISDNRREWIVADMALLSLGAVDVPRGSDSTEDEIAYILGHADCRIAFTENGTQARKIVASKKRLPLLDTIIVIEPGSGSIKATGITVVPMQRMIEDGEKLLEEAPRLVENEVDKGKAEDVVTIIYTSGTTGEPKGVLLTNRNYTFQLERVYEHIHVRAGHVYMSVLPSWHSFERLVEYVVLNIGATLAYSKPVGSILMADMQKVRPQWMAAVPRLWEAVRAAVYRNAASEGPIKNMLFLFFVRIGEIYASLLAMARGLRPQFRRRYRALDFGLAILPLILFTPFKLLGAVLVFGKLKKKLGGRFIAGISGGGALPPYVDRFFSAAGIMLLEGYGLTETAPVLAVRKQDRPVPGTVGPLLRDIEHKVVADDMSLLPPGHKGVLYVKSEQLMQGYYKQPEKTREVLADGWLNTGDVVVFTHGGEFRIVGRTKETIVLLGGENVEPAPIEDKLRQSDAIAQVMIIGQDQKYLAALVVPDFEFVEKLAKERRVSYFDRRDLLDTVEVQQFYLSEIQTLVNAKTGFKSFERVFRFKLLTEEFKVGEEMTHTLKIKRDVVQHAYQQEIEALFQ